MGIKVRATTRGYYGTLREQGDEFEILSEKDMGLWMVKVADLPQKRRKGSEETGGGSDPLL